MRELTTLLLALGLIVNLVGDHIGMINSHEVDEKIIEVLHENSKLDSVQNERIKELIKLNELK